MAPPRLIIVGAPASGKGTQCERLKAEFKVVHLSTGDILREAIVHGTDIGLEVNENLVSGFKPNLVSIHIGKIFYG